MNYEALGVKSAARTLDIFEVFAQVRKPQTLKELAARIGAPVSSTSMLVNTLVGRGYVYSLGKRGALYPTRRLLDVARTLATNDPIIGRVRPLLEALRDRMEETVTFSTREGQCLVYLDVVESPHAIRFSAQPGELRPLHANSAGKAILAEMSAQQRRRLIAELPMTRLTPATVVDPTALEAELAIGKARGWFLNDGESVADVMAVGRAVGIRNEWFGLAIVGPIHRMSSRVVDYAKALTRTVHDMESLEL